MLTFLVPNWGTWLSHTFKLFWPIPTGLPPLNRSTSKACFDALNLVSPQRLSSAWPWGLEREREVLMKDKNRLRRENTKKVCTELVTITALSVVPGALPYDSLNALTASFFSRDHACPCQTSAARSEDTWMQRFNQMYWLDVWSKEVG